MRAGFSDALKAAVVCGFLCLPLGAQVVLIDAQGQPARVQSPERLTEQQRQAVDDFSRVLNRMAQMATPAHSEAEAGAVVLECTNEIPEDIRDNERFFVRSHDNTLTISAKTPLGFCQGVYWFLRTHAGVRWYTPDINGEFISKKEIPWILPAMEQSPAPSFLSRQIYGLHGAAGQRWALRNGIGNPFSMGHALGRIINGDVLKKNPAWRGFFAGKENPATDAAARQYHPELTEEACARFCGQQAARFFEKNPRAFSYSLSLDDHPRFSQSQKAVEARGALHFYRSLPDYSDTVFAFMNTAAHELQKTGFKNKYIGCLSYQWNTDTPSFALEKNIIPFVCSDRSFWHDPKFREDETGLLKRWANSGTEFFGIYDYLYGNPFLIPRPLELLPQWLKRAHQIGARAYFAEAIPVPQYDTQKLWVLMQLLWDIDADASQLQSQWYAQQYGGAAAPVRAFFSLWEDAWHTQKENIYWLRGYHDETQGLLATPAQLGEMANLLREAQQQANELSHSAAVAALTQRFRFSEAFCKMELAKAKLARAAQPTRYHEAQRLYENLTAFLAAQARFDIQCARPYALGKRSVQLTVRADPSAEAALKLARWARERGRGALSQKWLAPLAGHSAASAQLKQALQCVYAPQSPHAKRIHFLDTDWSQTRAANGDDVNPLWLQYDGTLPRDFGALIQRAPALALTYHTDEANNVYARLSGAKNFHLYRVETPIQANAWRVDMRGQVSEGTIILLRLWARNPDGIIHQIEERLYPGNYTQWRSLRTVLPQGIAPSKCAFSLIVSHQGEGDWIDIKPANPLGFDAAKTTPYNKKNNPLKFLRHARGKL